MTSCTRQATQAKLTWRSIGFPAAGRLNAGADLPLRVPLNKVMVTGSAFELCHAT